MLLCLIDNQSSILPMVLTNALNYCVLHNIVVILRKNFNYQLRPLSEEETFIKVNKHLPEIRSAQEMQANGVSINELQTQLLQKIEELSCIFFNRRKGSEN